MNPKLREQIIRRDGLQCGYCGQPLLKRDVEIDHVIARCHGGGDEEENLHVACQKCNGMKLGKAIDAFLETVMCADDDPHCELIFDHCIKNLPEWLSRQRKKQRVEGIKPSLGNKQVQKSVGLDEDFIRHAESVAFEQRRSLSSLLADAIYRFFEWKRGSDGEREKEDEDGT